MDKEEYEGKYSNLRILKSIQEYLKAESKSQTAVYPINVPDDLVYQVLKSYGAEKADKLIHHIFKLGLETWSEKLYEDAFGSAENLEEFIEQVKERNKK